MVLSWNRSAMNGPVARLNKILFRKVIDEEVKRNSVD